MIKCYFIELQYSIQIAQNGRPGVTLWTTSSHRFASLTPDELSGVASNVELKVDVLSRGAVPSRTWHVQYQDRSNLDLTELNAHVRASGGFNPDGLAIVSVARTSGATICGAPMDKAAVLVIPGGVEITAGIKPGFRYAAVIIPTALWLEAQETATGMMPAAPTVPAAVRLDQGRAQDFKERLSRLLDHVAASPRTEEVPPRPSALLEHVGFIAEAFATPGDAEVRLDRSLRRRLQQAWAAQDFIAAHIHEDIPIMRLCQEIGVSRRQLEYAFRTAFDVAPHEFIGRMRLNEVRRRLMTARRRGLTIADVAFDTGITHLGRFSAAYRRLFGESPRVTFGQGRKLEERPGGRQTA
jgi:AraC-like DNA-binding protein